VKIGIVGFAGTGKTTIFRALTGMDVAAGPATSLQQKNLGVVDVHDPRLEHLRRVYTPKKYTPARFDIVDYAGVPREVVRGKTEFMDSIRDADALLAVIGSFEGGPFAGDALADTKRQLESFDEELQFSDLETIERRIERLQAQLKKGSKNKDQDERQIALMQRGQQHLEANGHLRAFEMSKDEQRLQSGLKFLTDKPRLVLFNVSEPDLGSLAGLASEQTFVLSAALEAEIATLPEAERADFLKSYGLSEPLSRRAARSAFGALDLISFFTVGDDEVRAWAIARGDDAVTAAGKIHTDLARGFIRAEVVPYATVEAATNQKDYKQLAKQDLKGKEYVVCDGDIINIRFSV